MNNLHEKEFELDKKHRMYIEAGDTGTAAHIEYQLRRVQAENYGWREVSKTHGIDVEGELVLALKRRIVELETKQAFYQGIIDNYDSEVKRLEDEISSLQAKIDNDIGYTPSPEEIQKKIDELSKLHENYHDAVEDLPKIERKLDDLRKRLSKIEIRKKFSKPQPYPSPSAELTARAKAYALSHNVDYEQAAIAVCQDDEVLNEAYEHYNLEELLGVEG
jgi:predicted RNase H-like nuclease (RuvC/YqgF family)